MGVYAYCVTDAGHLPPAALRGLGGGAVRALPVAEVAVWLSSLEARPDVRVDAVTEHHQVVSCAASLGSVAPLRFGAWASTETALRQRLDANKAAFVRMLRAVDGSVELGLRIREHPVDARARREARANVDEGGDSSSGRAYLLRRSIELAARRLRRDRQDAVAEDVAELLGDLLREQRVERLDAPELIGLAHLVGRGAEGEYRRRVRAYAQAAGLDVHVSGPWPPYSFVSLP